MKSRKTFIVMMFVVALTLIALPVLSACTPKVPAKEKVIKVGYLMDITGPIAFAVGKNGPPQYLASYRYMNETGLFGSASIDVLWEDYSGNVDRAVAAYKKMKDAGVVVFRPMTTISGEAIQPLGTRDQIPIVGNSTTDKLLDPTQWHYTASPSYTQMFTTILKWIKDNWKDPSRKPRVAQVGNDAPIGRGHIAASEAYAKEIGVDVGPWEFIPMIPLDTTPNILRLKDSKADFVIFQLAGPAGADVVLRDAVKLGLLNNFTWIAGLQVAHWEQVPGHIKEMDGIYGINEAPYPDEQDNPGVKFMTDVLSRYLAPDPTLKRPYFGTVTNLMWTADFILGEAVRRALDKGGYDKLNGKAVKDALDTIKDYDPHGLRVPQTFGPNRRQGSATFRILKMDYAGQTWRPVTNWLVSPAKYDDKGQVTFK